MNKTHLEKQATKETRMTRGVRRVWAASERDGRESLKAADRQIAEIERTFTLRYEW
jgi:hypothetical protein